MSNDYGIEVELDTLVIKGDPSKLYDELAKAQLEFKPVPRGSVGQVGQQKFQYASYSTLVRCVRPALSAHGITIFQPLHSRGDMAVTTTILAGHGASITSSFSFKSEFTKKFKDGTVVDDPQEFGRHHTYYRRYQLQAMLGIEGDKDADELPDVNEAQYTEVAKVTGKPVEASSPKASVEPKPASTVSAKEPKTNGSAKPSEPTTKPLPTETTRNLNEVLQAGIEQLGWKMVDVKEFYKEHVDAAGFDKAANLSAIQKQALLGKMVELKQVIPF